jgi:hypothetical protein
MALQLIEIMPGRFLYRCDACPFEYPEDPVAEYELSIPPRHNCPSEAVNIKEIMDKHD